MSDISALFSTGFNPKQFVQSINQNFEKSDINGNGSISKSEAVSSLGEKGIEGSKIDKLFSRIDSDSNGEISLEEKDAFIQSFQDRFSNLQSGSGYDNQQFDAIKTLLESFASSADDADKRNQFEEAATKLEEKNYSKDSLADAISLLKAEVTAVNTKV